MKRIVFAQGRVHYEARVMVRGNRCKEAGPELANGTASKGPPWLRQAWYDDGQSLAVDMDADIGSRDLHAIANGPIMDPSALYLPAGKISLAEAKAREAAQIVGDDAV